MTVHMHCKLVGNLLSFRLFFCKKPRNQEIKWFHEVSSNLLFHIDLFIHKHLLENELRNPNDILRIDMGSILKTANCKQKNILPWVLHLNPINVDGTNIEETSDIFENANKNETELLKSALNTCSVISRLLFSLICRLLFQRRFIRHTQFKNSFQLSDIWVNDVNLIPNDVVVDIVCKFRWSVDEQFNLLPHITEKNVIRER